MKTKRIKTVLSILFGIMVGALVVACLVPSFLKGGKSVSDGLFTEGIYAYAEEDGEPAAQSEEISYSSVRYMVSVDKKYVLMLTAFDLGEALKSQDVSLGYTVNGVDYFLTYGENPAGKTYFRGINIRTGEETSVQKTTADLFGEEMAEYKLNVYELSALRGEFPQSTEFTVSAFVQSGETKYASSEKNIPHEHDLNESYVLDGGDYLLVDTCSICGYVHEKARHALAANITSYSDVGYVDVPITALNQDLWISNGSQVSLTENWTNATTVYHANRFSLKGSGLANGSVLEFAFNSSIAFKSDLRMIASYATGDLHSDLAVDISSWADVAIDGQSISTEGLEIRQQDALSGNDRYFSFYPVNFGTFTFEAGLHVIRITTQTEKSLNIESFRLWPQATSWSGYAFEGTAENKTVRFEAENFDKSTVIPRNDWYNAGLNRFVESADGCSGGKRTMDTIGVRSYIEVKFTLATEKHVLLNISGYSAGNFFYRIDNNLVSTANGQFDLGYLGAGEHIFTIHSPAGNMYQIDYFDFTLTHCSADGNHVYNVIDLDDDSHQYVCSHCGADGEIEGHTYGDPAILVAPTVSSEGTAQYTCTACGHTKTEPIAPVEFVSMTVEGMPVLYCNGATVDRSLLSVKLIDEEGGEHAVGDYTLDKSILTMADTTITLSCQGFSETFDIFVADNNATIPTVSGQKFPTVVQPVNLDTSAWVATGQSFLEANWTYNSASGTNSIRGGGIGKNSVINIGFTMQETARIQIAGFMSKYEALSFASLADVYLDGVQIASPNVVFGHDTPYGGDYYDFRPVYFGDRPVLNAGFHILTIKTKTGSFCNVKDFQFFAHSASASAFDITVSANGSYAVNSTLTSLIGLYRSDFVAADKSYTEGSGETAHIVDGMANPDFHTFTVDLQSSATVQLYAMISCYAGEGVNSGIVMVDGAYVADFKQGATAGSWSAAYADEKGNIGQHASVALTAGKHVISFLFNEGCPWVANYCMSVSDYGV